AGIRVFVTCREDLDGAFGRDGVNVAPPILHLVAVCRVSGERDERPRRIPVRAGGTQAEVRQRMLGATGWRDEDLLRRAHVGVDAIGKREGRGVSLEVHPVKLYALEAVFVTFRKV